MALWRILSQNRWGSEGDQTAVTRISQGGLEGHQGQVEWNTPFPPNIRPAGLAPGPTPARNGGALLCFSTPFQQGNEPSL